MSIDTNALAKEIMADAKAIWDDPEKIHEFCQIHKTQLTIEENTFQGRRIAVLHMVAKVRLEGRYEWTVMDCLGGDILLMILRETPPESIRDRNDRYLERRYDDNDNPTYYPSDFRPGDFRST